MGKSPKGSPPSVSIGTTVDSQEARAAERVRYSAKAAAKSIGEPWTDSCGCWVVRVMRALPSPVREMAVCVSMVSTVASPRSPILT
ncbi:hypothetical protein ABH917_004051 [Thermobifida halotolerans]